MKRFTAFVGRIALIRTIRERFRPSPRQISIAAISVALVFVMVRFVQMPIPPTGGYFHPGAVAEVFVALAFGPVFGLVGAGIGSALADLTSAYAHFAPLTLVAHSALGYLTGLLGWKKNWGGMLIGWLAGSQALVIIYLIGESAVPGLYGGFVRALGEVGFNVFQVSLGLLGLVLFRLVKQAYPEIERLGEQARFEEL